MQLPLHGMECLWRMLDEQQHQPVAFDGRILEKLKDFRGLRRCLQVIPLAGFGDNKGMLQNLRIMAIIAVNTKKMQISSLLI